MYPNKDYYRNSGGFQRRNPNKVSINGQIRALEMRVIDQHGKNLGVLQKEEALKLAEEAGLDLIEVSSSATPPICKIADYGKHAYEVSKKKKEVKAKQVSSETKNIQISVEISDNDILIKAKRAAEWLKEGHRVKIDLQMRGRTKYLDEAFLRSRMDRILAIIPCEYKLAEPVKKNGNKFMTVLEKVR